MDKDRTIETCELKLVEFRLGDRLIYSAESLAQNDLEGKRIPAVVIEVEPEPVTSDNVKHISLRWNTIEFEN